MTINVQKNKQRSCKHLKSCRKIHEFWTPYPLGVTHLIIPLFNIQKTIRTLDGFCPTFGVKQKVTSDQWPHNLLITKRNAATWSFEIFLNLGLTDAKTVYFEFLQRESMGKFSPYQWHNNVQFKFPYPTP